MAMIDAHLTDGRTVFRCMSRGTLIRMFKRDLDTLDEGRAEHIWVMWHPQAEWEKIAVHYVKKHSVAFIRNIGAEERNAFLAEHEPERVGATA